jgi:hypothetical protein
VLSLAQCRCTWCSPAARFRATGAGDGTTDLLVEPNNYALSFDVNGGSGSAPATMVVYAGSVGASDRSLPAAATPPPAVAAFMGWFTAPAGGTRVGDGTDLRALAGDGPVSVALFARYAAPVSITTQPPAATPPAPAGPAATAPAPAISRVWLGSRCVRRSR